MAGQNESDDPSKAGGGFLGSLRDALAAASRDDNGQPKISAQEQEADKTLVVSDDETRLLSAPEEPRAKADAAPATPPNLPSASEAAREARGGTPNIPPIDEKPDRHVEFEPPPTTRVVRQSAAAKTQAEPARTQIVRGAPELERGDFNQDPVVGWLVITGGPGIGSYRPIFEGNNTIGRGASNRIALDFGDETISSQEQAYIRYDSTSRGFLLVPNMTKTNIVSVNKNRPTSAIPLQSQDVIEMGLTQLVFVAFCGPDFDWSDIAELKKG